MFTSEQLKSLELLERFVKETPKDELKGLLASYEVKNPNGVTYAQYMDELESQLGANNLFFNSNWCNNPFEQYCLEGVNEENLNSKHPPPGQFKITNTESPEISGLLFY